MSVLTKEQTGETSVKSLLDAQERYSHLTVGCLSCQQEGRYRGAHGNREGAICLNASGQMASTVLSAMAGWQVAWMKEEPPSFMAGSVSKGTVFRKTLDIPPERIQAVEQEPQDQGMSGKVTIEASEEETEALRPVGEEPLDGDNPDWLDRIEQEIPTAEGLREMEADRRLGAQTSKDTLDQVEQEIPTAEGLRELETENRQAVQVPEEPSAPPGKTKFLLSVLGPGFLAGMAGNDSSAVTAYSVCGGQQS